MDPSIVKALLHIHGIALELLHYKDGTNLMNVALISSLLTCCHITVDECVQLLKEHRLNEKFTCPGHAVEIAYSDNNLPCVEVLTKCCVLDTYEMNKVMKNLAYSDKYECAKHFITRGYTLRNYTLMPDFAFIETKWLKLFMEEADGMHLLFPAIHKRWTLLHLALQKCPMNHEVCQYLRQLQFLSSFIVITAPQRHSHFHKRARMNHPMKNMPLDMFRLIGAMLV